MQDVTNSLVVNAPTKLGLELDLAQKSKQTLQKAILLYCMLASFIVKASGTFYLSHI